MGQVQTQWLQVNVLKSETDTDAESTMARLGRVMHQAEKSCLITGWFFVRKSDWWRWRYFPASSRAAEAVTVVNETLNRFQREGEISRWVQVVYEPEIYAFGGFEAMDVAHSLFHRDSRGVIANSQHVHGSSLSGQQGGVKELSVLLCSALLRGARQEWTEQGDVWAKVSEKRPLRNGDLPEGVSVSTRKLMRADVSATLAASYGHIRDWLSAFEVAGRDLEALYREGALSRGVRAVLAHHIIFHWNRIGLPQRTQCLLSLAASKAVLGESFTPNA